MKALRIIGLILAVSIIGLGTSEYFLHGAHSLFGIERKVLAILFPFFASFTALFMILSFSLGPNKKALAIVSILIVLAFTAFASYYVYYFYVHYYNLFHLYGYKLTKAAITFTMISIATISFIFLCVVASAKPNEKVKKQVIDNNKTSDEQETNALSQEAPDANYANFLPQKVENQSNENTISERERILRLKEELADFDFNKVAPSNDDEWETFKAQETMDDIVLTNEALDTEDLRASIARDEADVQADLAQLERARAATTRNDTVAVSTSSERARAPINSVQQPARTPMNPDDYITNGAMDPYKRTIIPRRQINVIDPAKYAVPVGNTPAKISAANPVHHNHVREVKLEEYKDRIFLGDSDRIWELMKKQDRSLLQKQAAVSLQANRTVDFNGNVRISRPAHKTADFGNRNIVSKQSTKTRDLTSEIPTIDWDDD